MKYILTESQYNRIISEQTSSDLYSAILGYLDLYGNNIMNTAKDKLKMLSAKKEVMKFCENKRDGKPSSKFKIPESTALFNTVLNSNNIPTATMAIRNSMNILALVLASTL
jgi:hypothetical protein